MKTLITTIVIVILSSCSKPDGVTWKLSYIDTYTKSQDYKYNFETDRGCKCGFQPYSFSCVYSHGLPEGSSEELLRQSFYKNWDTTRYKLYNVREYCYTEDWGRDGKDHYFIHPDTVNFGVNTKSPMEICYELGLIDSLGHYIY